MKLQNFRRFSTTDYIQAQRTELVIPAFTLEASTWNGASTLLAEYAIGNTENISIKKPVSAFGENFVAAVRWRVDDVYFRYVFWADNDAVLFFPVYNGEVIAASAVIEIWSVNTTDAPTLAENKILESSILVFPREGCSSCCRQPSSQILLVQTGPIVLPPGECNPFCDAVESLTGACTIGEACSILTEAACIALGGTYGGDGSACPTAPEPPNQPAWPTPDPWFGSQWYGPIHAPSAAFPSFFVGVAPIGDPTAYTDGISPGATAAWVAKVWEEFLLNVPSYTSARIIWAFVNLTDVNYTGFSVFPAMNPDNYSVSNGLTYSPVVEYIV